MKKIFKLPIVFIFFIFLSNTQIFAQNGKSELSFGKPEEVGMSSERLKRVDDLLQNYFAKKWIPGAVAIIARKGKIVYYNSLGTSGLGADKAMQKEDLFRIASMTKAVTSVAVLMLYEEGKFLLDDPISKFIPEFKNPKVLIYFNEKDSSYTSEPAKSEITIRQLLTHTSGIPYGFMEPKRFGAITAKAKVPDLAIMEKTTIGEKIKILASLPLLHNPGEKWTYGLNTDVLGYLVEVASGLNLSDFFEQRIFKPLGMNDTRFFFSKNDEQRLVKMYKENKQGVVEKYTNEPEAKLIDFPTQGAKTYFSGGSGLTCTAIDYLKFLQMLLNKGAFNGSRILSRKTVELMSSNQIGNLFLWDGKSKFGLGLSVESEESSKKMLGSLERLSWGGAFNTHYWLDTREGIVAVLMTQIYPTTHRELFDKFEVATYQAIID